MRGCLVPLLATLGVLLLLPGFCFLSLGDLVGAKGYGGVILGTAGVLIAAAIFLHLLARDD